MAMTFRKVKCPHCRKVIVSESYHGVGDKHYFGNPERVCMYCSKPYYDNRYVEIATKPFSWYANKKPFSGAGLVLCYSRFAFFAIALLSKQWRSFCITLCIAACVLWFFYKITHTEFVVDEKFEEEYKASRIRIMKREAEKRAREEIEAKERENHHHYTNDDFRSIIAKAKEENRK